MWSLALRSRDSGDVGSHVLWEGIREPFLKVGSVLDSSVTGLPKINTNSGHITRDITQTEEGKSLCSLDWPEPARSVTDASEASPRRGTWQLVCVLWMLVEWERPITMGWLGVQRVVQGRGDSCGATKQSPIHAVPPSWETGWHVVLGGQGLMRG